MSIAQEFLDERIYSVPAKTAAEFLEQLILLFESAATLDQGSLSPSEFKQDDLRYFFRGQTDGSFGLNSSLYRAIKDSIPVGSSPQDVEKIMAEAELRVIEGARTQGIGRNLTDLELLTVLQHHLIPTRLIDVSASWPVGLFFATEELDGLDGRFFVIVTRPGLWEEFPRSSSDAMSWPTAGARQWQRTTWPILLPFTDPRMVSQQGYFLTGGLATNVGKNPQYWRDTHRHPPKGGQSKSPLTQEELREVSTLMIKFPALSRGSQGILAKLEDELRGQWSAAALTIAVPAGFKRELREQLNDRYQINKDSIYPPLTESVRLLKRIAAGKA